jgi:hypothetical protein
MAQGGRTVDAPSDTVDAVGGGSPEFVALEGEAPGLAGGGREWGEWGGGGSLPSRSPQPAPHPERDLGLELLHVHHVGLRGGLRMARALPQASAPLRVGSLDAAVVPVLAGAVPEASVHEDHLGVGSFMGTTGKDRPGS